MQLSETIGNNIRKLMNKRSVTVVELAKELSISRQTLQNYLKGSNVIDSVKLIEIAKYFCVSPSVLLKTENNIEDKCPNLLFRTALNYNTTTENLVNDVMTCINSYYNLTSRLGNKISYFPEQYNLSINIEGEPININYQLNHFHNVKITNDLRNDLRNIAIEQRRNLGCTNKSPLEAISILQKKGINIFFIDLKNSDINGFSYVDDEKGCYIFVNSNQYITLERIIFTVFHEYGHIILHRPLYKRENRNIKNENNILDTMANIFAAHFLVPYDELLNYEPILSNFKSLHELTEIKHHFQVSLQTLILSLNEFGYIDTTFKNYYFKYIKENGINKFEFEPLFDIPEVKDNFLKIKNEKIIELLRDGYCENIVGLKTIKSILWLDDENANSLIKEFAKFKNKQMMFNEQFDEYLKFYFLSKNKD